MFGFVSLIQDTVQGAIILSIFDFLACFLVLYFIGLIIKGLGLVLNKKGGPKENA